MPNDSEKVMSFVTGHESAFTAPATAKVVFDQAGFFCNVNRVEDEGPGGLVSIVIDPPHAPDDSFFEDKKLTGGTLSLNYRKDEPMRQWPVTLEQKKGKRYRIIVMEYDAPA